MHHILKRTIPVLLIFLLLSFSSCQQHSNEYNQYTALLGEKREVVTTAMEDQALAEFPDPYADLPIHYDWNRSLTWEHADYKGHDAYLQFVFETETNRLQGFRYYLFLEGDDRIETALKIYESLHKSATREFGLHDRIFRNREDGSLGYTDSYAAYKGDKAEYLSYNQPLIDIWCLPVIDDYTLRLSIRDVDSFPSSDRITMILAEYWLEHDGLEALIREKAVKETQP